jgi:hypothetical protein
VGERGDHAPAGWDSTTVGTRPGVAPKVDGAGAGKRGDPPLSQQDPGAASTSPDQEIDKDRAPLGTRCCHCKAYVVGDHGAELTCGCWVCCADHWEAEVGPADAPSTHRCKSRAAAPDKGGFEEALNELERKMVEGGE